MDIKRAYDSVSVMKLQMILTARNFPRELRLLPSNIVEYREVRVKTTYGMTEPFKQKREVLSPVLWKIFKALQNS